MSQNLSSNTPLRKTQTLPDITKLLLLRFVTIVGKQPLALCYCVNTKTTKPHRWSRYSPCKSYRRNSLQTWRSWIKFPMVPCIFFIGLLLLAARWPELNSVPNKNECQGYFLWVKAAGAYDRQPCHLVSIIYKFLESHPHATLWVCHNLYRTGFTFTPITYRQLFEFG